MTAVVICGRIGSGKSTAAKFVADEFRIKNVSFGKYLHYLAGLNAGSTSRESLQDLGDREFRSRGAPAFLRDTMRHFAVACDESAVFDGVRHIEMLEAIRQRAGMTVAIYLKLGQTQRMHRARLRDGCSWSHEKFLLAERHPAEVGIGKLMEQCDLVLDASLPAKSVQRILLDRVAPCMVFGKSQLPNGDCNP